MYDASALDWQSTEDELTGRVVELNLRARCHQHERFLGMVRDLLLNNDQMVEVTFAAERDGELIVASLERSRGDFSD